MFEFDTVQSFFSCLAHAHHSTDNPEVEAKFNMKIGEEITKYLWNSMQSKVVGKFDGDDWHEGEPLQMVFEGGFEAYQRFRQRVLDENIDVFGLEYETIKSWMEHEDHKPV